MKRRSAIKNLMIFAGGIYLLPSCAGNGKSSIELKNLDILVGEEALLGEVAEAMIPKTADAPGARGLNLHLFTLKMVDDCHNAEDQKAFKAGLASLNKISLEKNNKPFNQLDAITRIQFIESTLKDTTNNPALRTFFEITKRRVIQGFTNSKYVMTDLKQYEMVPGRYNGYFPVDKV
ncbi:gluconate 2-dehydrogenase subunit 3 family protein [Agriterribacter sp.]|uniref:gluconate 2-dehydrogenase subunit 3 family protein n=1 Tax=Agriterribacter sp. TaxID=2821509 RepID=UPI002CC1BA90|nr:gluconate 2-dehydrogenase subunit 3 family protein [Agriterribacter sp.]HTN08014.1 gluconate 2-dehydrogenase subunit 3 family protein [Agriterribacter sp.]